MGGCWPAAFTLSEKQKLTEPSKRPGLGRFRGPLRGPVGIRGLLRGDCAGEELCPGAGCHAHGFQRRDADRFGRGSPKAAGAPAFSRWPLCGLGGMGIRSRRGEWAQCPVAWDPPLFRSGWWGPSDAATGGPLRPRGGYDPRGVCSPGIQNRRMRAATDLPLRSRPQPSRRVSGVSRGGVFFAFRQHCSVAIEDASHGGGIAMA